MVKFQACNGSGSHCDNTGRVKPHNIVLPSMLSEISIIEFGHILPKNR